MGARANVAGMRCVALLGMVMVLGLVACSREVPEPNLASSASSPGYAERFPAKLAEARQGYFEDEKAVRETIQAMGTYQDALEDPDWDVVHRVVDLSDRQGRSRAYSEHFERTEAVRAFFEDEKDELRRKVAGSVQYTAKKKKCEGDVGSSAAAALEKAFEEQVEESLHSKSDAHLVIEQYEPELGPKNAEALEKQSDAISEASYVAHVGAVRRKLELRSMIEEVEQVKNALKARIDELKRLEAQPDLEEARRSDVIARREAAEKALQRMDTELTGAENLLSEIEERTRTLQKEYDEALLSLLGRIDAVRSGRAAE